MEDRIKFNQRVQGKFTTFLNSLSQNLSKPQRKFIKEATKGILVTRSPIIRQIAKTLNEKISLHKVCQRLYRHIDDDNLSSVENRLIDVQTAKLTSNTVIAVDSSDIIKPEAKRMEGLSRVRDGNTGQWTEGYDLMNILAITPEKNNFKLTPLSSELYSNRIEEQSAKTILFDKLNDIIIAGGNKGIYTFDRGFDDRKVIEQLTEGETDFIIKAKNNRNLVDLQNTAKEIDIIKFAKKKIALNHSITVAKATSSSDRKANNLQYRHFRCGIRKVGIRLNPHPLKKPKVAECYLVVAKFKKGGYFYFYANFYNQGQLTEKKIIEKVLSSYRLRWKIEEMHRFVKQDYSWESMQLLKYNGLKNLNLLLLIATSFIFSLNSYLFYFVAYYSSIFIDKLSDLSILNRYCYYRISEVIQTIFRFINFYKKVKRKLRIDKNQLTIFSILDGVPNK